MTEYEISENDLQTYEEYLNDLQHHGILGQKWGRTNGPPYPLDAQDHSAAEKKAGWRKSLEGATEKIKQATKRTQEEINARKENKKPVEKKAEEKKPLDKKSIINSADAKTIQENASQLTTQELQEAVNRMNLMQQVNRNVPTPPTVQDKIDGAIGKLDKAATTVTNGINAYNKIAKIYNKFQDPPLPVLDSSAAERAEKAAKDKKEAVEKQRKELIDKAVKSGDPEKIMKVAGLATNEELGGAAKRLNSLKVINDYMNKDSSNDTQNAKKKESKQNDQQQNNQQSQKKNEQKESSQPKQETKEESKQESKKSNEPSYKDRLGDLASKSMTGNNGWTSPEEKAERLKEAQKLYDDNVEKLRKEAYSRRLSDMATDKAYEDLIDAYKRK